MKTLHGLEPVLAQELAELGAKEVQPINRAVACEGSKELLYKANLQLRTALRVLQPIHHFSAQNENELYKNMRDFDWSPYLQLNQTFAIDSVVNSNYFTHSKYIALKVKDAIADQFRQKTGRRPSVDTDNPDIRINVHVTNMDFTLALDSSGESLHKRGYRQSGYIAPLNEVMTAGMLLLMKWHKDIPLIDPMCGSGTVLLEAAMIAGCIPPGINRNHYGFMKWNDFDKELWKQIIDEAREGIQSPVISLFGADISQHAIDITKEASIKMGVVNQLNLLKSSFTDYIPHTNTGMVVMNPPYGERMPQENICSFYKMIGDHLKKNFAGFDAWILSSNKEALKHLGLRPSRKLILYNGPLECKFQKFSLYQGSKKDNYTKNGIKPYVL